MLYPMAPPASELLTSPPHLATWPVTSFLSMITGVAHATAETDKDSTSTLVEILMPVTPAN